MNLEHYTHRLSINTLYYTASLLQLYGTTKDITTERKYRTAAGYYVFTGKLKNHHPTSAPSNDSMVTTRWPRSV